MLLYGRSSELNLGERLGGDPLLRGVEKGFGNGGLELRGLNFVFCCVNLGDGL